MKPPEKRSGLSAQLTGVEGGWRAASLIQSTSMEAPSTERPQVRVAGVSPQSKEAETLIDAVVHIPDHYARQRLSDLAKALASGASWPTEMPPGPQRCAE